MNPIRWALGRADQAQQGRRWLAFPFAVWKKFGDDQAGYLAALIAYYGFFSLFPLLLVFVTVMGVVLRSHPGLRDSVLHSTLAQFPVIGTEIRVNSLHASGLALVIGIVGALWAGLGVTQAAQNAMNTVWHVPRTERPNFFVSRVRGLILLAVLGTITVAATVVSGLGTARGTLVAVRVLTVLGSLALNLAMYLVAFRVLTRRRLSWRDVFAGACVGAVAWTILQFFGTFYVSHQVAGAKATYGTFAFVIGLLVWIYLGAQVTLYAAEVNVVRREHLWPRSLTGSPLTEADRRAYGAIAGADQQVDQEDVQVHFDDRDEAV
jgi:membrane protein